MRIARLVVLVCVMQAVAGCGQKGPLVLPDTQHPRKKIGIPKTPAAPSTQPPGPAAPSPSPPAPQS